MRVGYVDNVVVLEALKGMAELFWSYCLDTQGVAEISQKVADMTYVVRADQNEWCWTDNVDRIVDLP